MLISLLSLGAVARAQSDPGPRAGEGAAGGALRGLTSDQQALFLDGRVRFQEVEDVATNGLGPRFNANSCTSCHAAPTVGGTSPAANPQVEFANFKNNLPPFITPNGPVREARFIKNSNGTADGGVHALFTIAGQPDSPAGCGLTQENFSNQSNISLRIPTPTFGLGLIEAIADSTLVQNLSRNAGTNSRLGISGTLNHNGNDGTVTRFGWKAQNKSLAIFSSEAYNVEMGVTNMLFPNERDDTPNCSPVASPQDVNHVDRAGAAEFDDATAFTAFMRFLAPPTPAPSTSSAIQGQNVFVSIGCAACHSATLTTGPSAFGGALSNQTIHPYSDLALHHMGPGLADQISQGQAAGDQFRSAPLWGLGQRLFFLHDGRTSDLVQAIQAHSSNGNSRFPSSEANTVIRNYGNLRSSDKQALLNFLRSL